MCFETSSYPGLNIKTLDPQSDNNPTPTMQQLMMMSMPMAPTMMMPMTIKL